MKKLALGFMGISCLFFFALANRLGFTNTPQERYVTFDYEVTLEQLPEKAKLLNIWLPLMPDNDYQIVEETTVEPKEDSHITSDKIYGNKILHYSLTSPPIPLRILVHYKVRRLEYANRTQEGRERANEPEENAKALKKYLQPNHLVTLSPRVKQLAAQITKGKNHTLDKAKAIYDYVFKNVSYDKTIPGWGYGDTERVCLLKAGNCTDFHSLFISLARASGIPAKFVMGVPLTQEQEGEPKGYHCWAEFYDESAGWVPVDISEAWKDKSKYQYFFGSLNPDRLEFTQGRDIVLEPSQQGKPLNYFLYPYIEIDGKEFKDYAIRFKFRETVEQLGRK